MRAIKSTFISLVVTLTSITLVAGLSLGYVYRWTKEPIARARLAKQLRAIEAVVANYDNNPVSERFKMSTPDGKDSLEFFPARDKGELVGMAVKTRSGHGYNGDIWLMVGFTTKGDIQNIYVIEHTETPGLGSKMTQSSFMDQFLGKNPGEMKFKVRKNGGDVDGITGATISSKAFVEAVQLAYDTFKSMQDGNN